MKRILSMLLAITLLISMIPPQHVHAEETSHVQTTATASWSGTGSGSDPYLIDTEAELRLLAECVNAGNTYQGSYFSLRGTLP